MIREQELRDIIKSNNPNVIFLVETHSYAVNSESDYKITGFMTLVQSK